MNSDVEAGFGDFMAWMQASALGHFMRESGPWTYAIVNLCHIVGVALLFGAIVILDLRLIGVSRRTSLAALADAAAPVAAFGFLLAATSGVGLLATKATEYVGNPFIYIKFPPSRSACSTCWCSSFRRPGRRAARASCRRWKIANWPGWAARRWPAG